MKRLTVRRSAIALLAASLFSLLTFSPFAPLAQAQNRLRFPVVQGPVRDSLAEAPTLIPADDQNAPHFSAPSLNPTLTTPAPASTSSSSATRASATVAS